VACENRGILFDAQSLSHPEEIGRDFDMTRYSSVSSAIERVRDQILKDRKFNKRLDTLQAELTKGQTKT